VGAGDFMERAADTCSTWRRSPVFTEERFFQCILRHFGRVNGRTRQMTKNDNNSARLRRRAVALTRDDAKTVGNAFSRREMRGKKVTR